MKWFIRYTGYMLLFIGLLIIETIKFPYNFLRFTHNTNRIPYTKNIDEKRSTSDWKNGPYYKG